MAGGELIQAIGIDLDTAWQQHPAIVVLGYLGLVIGVALIVNAIRPADRTGPGVDLGPSGSDPQEEQHGEAA